MTERLSMHTRTVELLEGFQLGMEWSLKPQCEEVCHFVLDL